MLKSLAEASERFRDDENFLPLGYEKKGVNWIVRIDSETGEGSFEGPYRKKDLRQFKSPKRVRSGKVTDSNLKPYLLIDNASYALGINPGKEKEGKLCHKGFISLLEEAYKFTKNKDLLLISEFLRTIKIEDIPADMKPKDVVAFQVNPEEMPSERLDSQKFWRKYLEKEHVTDEYNCLLCGDRKPVIRVLPNAVTIMGQDCQLTSFNTISFESYGKKQTGNAPICFDCVANITESLSFLLRKKEHNTVISYDDSKGKNRYQLRDQLAIFWLKEKEEVKADDNKISFDIESVVAAPLTDNPEEFGKPSEKQAHLEKLLKMAWEGDESSLYIRENRFYLAVLTPNKSRLVLREWMDISLEKLMKNLKNFVQAARIIFPDGSGIWFPPIPAILNALRPEDVKSGGTDANIIRDLLRTAYKGHTPPVSLLRNAVMRFCIPDRKKEKAEDVRKQRNRRHALASAIKLVLTYNTKEAEQMEKQDEHQTDPAYLCGRLLAILEETQRRASGSKLNTTLADSFFTTACTSPATVFSVLLRRAKSSHFPQVRRKKKGYMELDSLVQDVMLKLDDKGAFPSELNVRQQGYFCLGFYSQRAHFQEITKNKFATKEIN